MASKLPVRFHSRAQRDKCRKLVEAKVMTQAQFDAMEAASPKHLPERAKAKR